MAQKPNREDVSIECLAKFHSNKAGFLCRFITIDETWVHRYTPETNRNSQNKGESAPKKAKTVPSARKVMMSFFWYAWGIDFIANLLQRLSD